MAKTLRDEAEALAVLLEYGFAHVKDAIGWADAHIAELDEPPYPLIEISMAPITPGADVIYLLRTLPGRVDVAEMSRCAITLIAASFEQGDASLDHVTDALCRMSLAGYVPDESAGMEMLILDHMFDDAANGSYGTVDEVEYAVRQFLSQYAE